MSNKPTNQLIPFACVRFLFGLCLTGDPNGAVLVTGARGMPPTSHYKVPGNMAVSWSSKYNQGAYRAYCLKR